MNAHIFMITYLLTIIFIYVSAPKTYKLMKNISQLIYIGKILCECVAKLITYYRIIIHCFSTLGKVIMGYFNLDVLKVLIFTLFRRGILQPLVSSFGSKRNHGL